MNTPHNEVLELESLLSSPVQILNDTSPASARGGNLGHSDSSDIISNLCSAASTAASSVTKSVNSDLPLQQRAPGYQFKKERVVHREILEYIAKGYTDVEIASLTGFTPPTIGNVRKHPMYQDSLLGEVKRRLNEDTEVVEFIKRNVVSAVETLADVMNDDKARNSDRISAAEALLNRRYGKPNQPINRGTDVDLSSLSDADLAKMLVTSNTETSQSI